MNHCKVLVLDGYARQCLPFLRAFNELGCETTQLCGSKIDCGYVSRMPKHKILGVCDPDDPIGTEKCIEELIKTKEYDLVFPLTDYSSAILSRRKAEWSQYARIAVNNWDVYQKMQDKLSVMKICMENGVPCPKTVFDISCTDDVLNANLQFPIVVKPRNGCGAKGFHRLETKEQFIKCVEENDIDLSLMVVQECIPIGSLVISDNIFVDANGEVKSSYLYGSHRFFPLAGGTGTFNISFDRADIHEQCSRLVKLMGIRGCVGIDLIIDSRDNIAKVIEVNPRVLACAKLGFICGVNQAEQTLQLEYGQEVTPYMEYKTDMRLRMSQTDILWFLKSSDRFKAKPSFFSIKNTKDQMFTWDDPLPWFAFLFRGLKNYKKEIKKRS